MQHAVAVPIAEAGDDGRGWTATWLGVLLMALGFVSLLSSSRTLQGAVLVGRFLDRRTELAAIADEGSSSFAFGRNTFDRPAAEPERPSRAA